MDISIFACLGAVKLECMPRNSWFTQASGLKYNPYLKEPGLFGWAGGLVSGLGRQEFIQVSEIPLGRLGVCWEGCCSLGSGCIWAEGS